MNDGAQNIERGEESRTALVGALLFASGGPVKFTALERMSGCPEAELPAVLEELRSRLQGTGMALVMTDTAVAMATAPEASETIAALRKKTLEGEIGQAGLEVLAIVLYRGASTRATIDYIRGVNSSATIRNLVARGIVERVRSKENAREFVYRPTADVLAHLGMRSSEDLPEQREIRERITAFEARAAQAESGESAGEAK